MFLNRIMNRDEWCLSSFSVSCHFEFIRRPTDLFICQSQRPITGFIIPEGLLGRQPKYLPIFSSAAFESICPVNLRSDEISTINARRQITCAYHTSTATRTHYLHFIQSVIYSLFYAFSFFKTPIFFVHLKKLHMPIFK